MSLRLGKDANINFLTNLSLIQEYSLLPDSTWFLSKDKFVAFIGRKTTTYRNVKVNDSTITAELDKNKVKEEVVTLPEAAGRDKSYWAGARHEELSKNEKGIIKMIDTLLNAPVFQKFTDPRQFYRHGGIRILATSRSVPGITGSLPIPGRGCASVLTSVPIRSLIKKSGGTVTLPMALVTSGSRERQSCSTCPSDIRVVTGTDPIRRTWIFGQSYSGEVTSDNIFALAIRKANIPAKFLKVEEKRFEFFNETRSGFSQLVTINHKIFQPLKNLPLTGDFITPELPNPMTTFEMSLRLRFAYLEKFLENQFFRTSLGSTYPIAEINFTRGIAGVFKSSYNYSKVFGSVSDYFKIPPFGSFSYYLYGGKNIWNAALCPCWTLRPEMNCIITTATLLT